MFVSRYFYTYFTVSFVATLTLWWFWWFYRDLFPVLVPFNYLAEWGSGQLVPAQSLWRLPLYTTLALIVTTSFSDWLWKREKLYAQLLLASMMFMSVIALLSFVRLVIMFT